MKRMVITSGDRYTDIDVLACAVSYTELLTKEGKSATPILPGIFNKSITDKIKKWDLKYEKLYKVNDGDSFIIVDVSEPDYIAGFVDQLKIVEIYDHHFGFEKYWLDRIGNKTKIKKVGACATLIWEEYKKRVVPLNISKTSANLLYTAIVSNTLNFKASVTCQRDIDAFSELSGFTKLPKNWIKTYFTDQDKAVLTDPIKEIINDTHFEKFPETNETLVIGQIELWNGKEFFNGYKNEIIKAMESFNTPLWFFTSPSISEGKNYIYTENNKIKSILEEKLNIKFTGDVTVTNKLLLRKEIKKIILNFS